MAKYAHADILDGGPAALKAGALRLLLLKAYSAADSYATVQSNAIASVVVAPTDFSLAGADNAPRVLTSAAKSGTATANSGATPNLHFAFTDNVGKVLYVTDETSDQVVTNGNPVAFPALTYTANQPT